MEYLIYQDLQSAKDRSFQIADEQGCTDDVTMYWFTVISHPTNGEGAMCIGEGEENKLTTQEQSELVNQQYMDDNGWFPPLPPNL